MDVNKLNGTNIVVYDLEIKKPIKECSRGWSSHDEMGISVGCAFDYRDMRYRVFMDDNIQELVDRLNEDKTLIVAFNHIGFDNKLIRASGLNLKPDHQLNNYDMLLQSRAAAGCASNFIPGFKLDDHLKALNLPMKTGNGELAPIWWQDGKLGTLIDYCMNDVTQEKNLFEYIVVNNRLACAYNPSGYKITIPEYFIMTGENP